ncbi:hypothetical protein CNEONATC25_03948 [Clostridium neonatale]|uniref:Uncharacterized protein n=1 Tax=Clostridium neonatale TaxID=137838 RepID=A0A650MVD9_9CLOT|nr:hypothetical protein CNEONATNEC32_03892 [Clostridium neonatale]SUQ54346.1 hypothetical protein CNEONATC25_03948 [Clostridium neonatale]SUQ54805.1 hypothetical protein CNEONATNEC26_03874 [Clostridium neonatale]VCT86303.1 hypothetical protein CNEONATNEC25_03917 [Clostridium neonatale]
MKILIIEVIPKQSTLKTSFRKIILEQPLLKDLRIQIINIILSTFVYWISLYLSKSCLSCLHKVKQSEF